MDCSLPCSSVHGLFQARILEWVAISFSRRSSQPRDQTGVFCTVGRSLPSETPGKSKEKSYCEIVCCLPVLIQYPFAFPHPAMILEVLPSAGGFCPLLIQIITTLPVDNAWNPTIWNWFPKALTFSLRFLFVCFNGKYPQRKCLWELKQQLFKYSSSLSIIPAETWLFLISLQLAISFPPEI